MKTFDENSLLIEDEERSLAKFLCRRAKKGLCAASALATAQWHAVVLGSGRSDERVACTHATATSEGEAVWLM